MTLLGLLLAVFLDAAARDFASGAELLRAALPDLAFLLAVWIGLSARSGRALVWGAVLGALQDGMSEWPLGHFAFLYGCATYVAFRLRRHFSAASPLPAAAATLFCGLLHALLALALAIASRDGAGLPGFGPALLLALSGAAAAPILFPLFERSRLFRRAVARPGFFAS